MAVPLQSAKAVSVSDISDGLLRAGRLKNACCHYRGKIGKS
ncbi:hypothetical protein V6667_06330 [Neisseria leonii]|uniref:Uncharacterized protein n=1 Tax=Neisseria leonii TaxID=2995413 RepID=A0A9X4E2V2_9NEIS|nr:hypothetical protein [Neisseria sp. 51.81]MDD9327724.1 hypothetical protein [Neisseria sp. 51.81]